MRTVTATRTNTWHIWASDAGGWGYSFGMKDMLASEHVHRVTLPSGEVVSSRRIYDDCIAVELADGAAYPETITVEIMDRSEWFAMQRKECAA